MVYHIYSNKDPLNFFMEKNGQNATKLAIGHLGPVIQSNVSLTTPLSKSSVKCLRKYYDNIYQYVLLQNVKFIWHISSCTQYFNENIFPLNMIDN